jgi:hypothetical protein
MQMQAGETEPNPPEHQGNLEEYYEWFIRAVIIGYIAGLCYAALRNDKYRLELLHIGIKTLQRIARTAGTCALLVEQAYNDTASSLH